MSIENAIAVQQFVEQQRKLRAKLKENLDLIASEINKLTRENQALEVREGKIDAALSLAVMGSDKYWHLVSSMNVVVKRKLEIPKEKAELRELARSLEPAIKQATRDVPKFREVPA